MLENKQQQGIVLEKALVIVYKRSLVIEIARTMMELKKVTEKLDTLRQAREYGGKYIEHWKKAEEIEGIPIHYKPKGLNRHIYYETNIEEAQEKFDKNMRIIMEWLTKNGHKPLLCKRMGKFEMGKGATCEI